MKKLITLNQRVDIAGEIRSPEEGAIAIDAKTADQLIKTKVATASRDDDLAPLPAVAPAPIDDAN